MIINFPQTASKSQYMCPATWKISKLWANTPVHLFTEDYLKHVCNIQLHNSEAFIIGWKYSTWMQWILM